jgi:hypothetical protein
MAALVGLGACLPPAWAQNELFVGNNNTQGFGSNPNSVSVYSRTASGNTAPIRNLSGPDTDLSAVGGVFVDAINNELVVGNTSGVGYITVYSPTTASGNTAPIRTLSGAATGINTPYGVFVDAVNDELFVANDGAPSITVYSRTANGNTAPIRTLMGAATGLSAPFGIFVDTVNNELVVIDSGNTTITVYSRTASGNTAPIRTLSGAATGLSFPSGVFVDTVNNELVVGDQLNGVSTGALRVYSRTANGNTAPIRTISGAATGLNRPVGVVVDTVNNEILAANSDGWSVTAHARTANGNAAPLRTLVGASTLLDQPYFLAITVKCKPNKKGKCKTPKPHP